MIYYCLCHLKIGVMQYLMLRAGRCTYCRSQTANLSYKQEKEKEQWLMLCRTQQFNTGATTQRVMGLVDWHTDKNTVP